MHYWEGDPMDGARAVVMILEMVGVWALLALVIVWAIRSSRSPNALATRATRPASGGTAGYAAQFLANRLAHGAIEPDEYRSELAGLRSGSAS